MDYVDMMFMRRASVYLEKAYKKDSDNINLAKCLADIYKRLQRNEEYELLKNVIEKSK